MATTSSSRLELLPAELIWKILEGSDLGPESLADVSQVSQSLRAYTQQDHLWQSKLEALAGTSLFLTQNISNYHELFQRMDPFWW